MTATVLEDATRTDELTLTARGALWDAWSRRARQRLQLERLRDYAEGRAGIPDVDEGANENLRKIAEQSVINMCGVVVDTFDAGLTVVGFHSPDERDNDPAWAWWQRNGLDARQSEVHRAALIYGYAYATVLPDGDGEPKAATWSPLDVVADYDDPRRDLFPTSATLLRRVVGGWSVLLVDQTHVTPGFIADTKREGVAGTVEGRLERDIEITGEPWEHRAVYDGQPVCPVVRFVPESTVEDRAPRGVVEPLITSQRSLNAVNYNRLVVADHGAFHQKIVIGWAGPADAIAKASAAKTWAFEDHPEDLRVTQLQGSPLEPYNSLINDIKEQIALEASIPIHAATGNMTNVSTDAAAMVEKKHQLRLARIRASFGESWEQLLRLAVAMRGDDQPADAAEMIWAETQARAFGAVVDGITKLAAIPPEQAAVMVELLEIVPGMTQQRIDAIREITTRQRSASSIDALIAAAGDADEGEGLASEDPDEVKKRADAMGVLIRSGVDPRDAARQVGLAGVRFTGAVPVSLRLPEGEAARLEDQ